jgi:hypothetical protein
MSDLNPILVLDRVIGEAQEPFFQAHRPFKTGSKWRELPVDPNLRAAAPQLAAGGPRS